MYYHFHLGNNFLDDGHYNNYEDYFPDLVKDDGENSKNDANSAAEHQQDATWQPDEAKTTVVDADYVNYPHKTFSNPRYSPPYSKEWQNKEKEKLS